MQTLFVTPSRLFIDCSRNACFVALIFFFTISYNTYGEERRLQCHFGAVYKGPSLLAPLFLEEVPAHKPNFENAVDTNLANLLDDTFKQTLALTSASKSSVVIHSHQYGTWAMGDSNRPFWLASIGKLATAIIIGQLIEEKQLLPGDTVERWLPDLKHGEFITIEHLLLHTSGIKSFDQIEAITSQRGFKATNLLIDLANEAGPDFCPGTDWNYSNTGYLILALIAEKLDEKPYHQIVEQRIAKPLGLSNFQVLTAKSKVDSLVIPDSKNRNEFIAEIAGIHGAGSIVADMQSSITFLAAYLRGELISDDAINDSLRHLHPLFEQHTGYGRGIMVTRVPDAERPSTWVGHSGGSEIGKALLVFDLQRQTYLAIALNAQAPAEAIANTLFKVLDSYNLEQP